MSLATFNGQPVLTCCVSLPAYGLWWADVECASDVVSTGASSLVLDDLTLRGTIVTGGTYQTRTRYRLVGGAGGWGKLIPAKSYANDLGVKLSTVLRDAASECGETLGAVDPAATVGPAFVRAAGPASRVLSELVPRGWYVDESGVTQIGRRAAVPFTGVATRMVNDAAQSRYELAPDAGTLSKLLPGAIVDGVEAVDVEHAIGDDGTLRTTLWGRGVADTSRMNEALRRIVEAFTAGSRYFAPWEYRVVQQSGDRLDLQIVRVSSGMPDLRAVRIRQSSGGVRVYPSIGSRVLVSFVNGDPSSPAVTAFDEQNGSGAVADELALQAGPTGATPPGELPKEHATSAEALTIALQGVIAAIGPAIGGGFGTAVTALSVAPAFDAVLATIAARTLAPTTKAALATALAAKSVDSGGDTPSLGWPHVTGG